MPVGDEVDPLGTVGFERTIHSVLASDDFEARRAVRMYCTHLVEKSPAAYAPETYMRQEDRPLRAEHARYDAVAGDSDRVAPGGHFCQEDWSRSTRHAFLLIRDLPSLMSVTREQSLPTHFRLFLTCMYGLDRRYTVPRLADSRAHLSASGPHRLASGPAHRLACGETALDPT